MSQLQAYSYDGSGNIVVRLSDGTLVNTKVHRDSAEGVSNVNLLSSLGATYNSYSSLLKGSSTSSSGFDSDVADVANSGDSSGGGGSSTGGSSMDGMGSTVSSVSQMFDNLNENNDRVQNNIDRFLARKWKQKEYQMANERALTDSQNRFIQGSQFSNLQEDRRTAQRFFNSMAKGMAKGLQGRGNATAPQTAQLPARQTVTQQAPVQQAPNTIRGQV